MIFSLQLPQNQLWKIMLHFCLHFSWKRLESFCFCFWFRYQSISGCLCHFSATYRSVRLRDHAELSGRPDGTEVTRSWSGSTAGHFDAGRRPPAAEIRRRRGLTRAGRPCLTAGRRVAPRPSARPHRYYCELFAVLPFIAGETPPPIGRRPCPGGVLADFVHGLLCDGFGTGVHSQAHLKRRQISSTVTRCGAAPEVRLMAGPTIYDDFWSRHKFLVTIEPIVLLCVI